MVRAVRNGRAVRTDRRRVRARTALGLAALTVAAAAAPSSGVAPRTGLPLGSPGLAETRTERAVAEGVTLTQITRGRAGGDAWRINVLVIDPRTAQGRLQVTHGPSLARTETTSELARFAGALAAVNGSFFSLARDPQYPGDPVGFTAYAGNVLSEPTRSPTEVGLLLDSAANRLTLGPFRWAGRVTNTGSGASLLLRAVNGRPAASAVVLFTDRFGSLTPAGPGLEVVLDPLGCVRGVRESRGTVLLPGFSTLQATGGRVEALRRVAGSGCVRHTHTVTGADGREVPLGPDVHAVTGRFVLVRGGQVVAPAGSGGLFARNPRTIAGTAADGRIILATVDGRRASSVGTTLAETARLALSLGMSDAVNLDGGGSTAMNVRGEVVNRPAGGGERRVSDALVYVCPACL